MADYVVTTVHTVEVTQQETLPAAVAITAGVYCYVDTNGKWALGSAAAQGTIGRRGGISVKAVGAGEALTCVIKGIMDFGGIFTAAAQDAQVFLSDTAGGILATTAGTVSKVVGTVRPAWASTTADKLLFVDL